MGTTEVIGETRTGGTATGDTLIVTESIADSLATMCERIFQGPPPVEIVLWDGSRLGPPCRGSLRLNGPDALRRLVWSPDELGLARAFVCGDVDIDGDVAIILRLLLDRLPGEVRIALKAVPEMIAATRRFGAIGRPPPLPAAEAVPHGVRHSLRRDREAISHHYDVGNEFYELVLGEAMTYSCARFLTPDTTLEAAQAAKHELVCRKLGLDESGRPRRARLLDVGCGWGSMAIHAATEHEVDVVAVTISTEQAAYARRRVERVGLGDRVEVRVQDYREITDGPFDAISSIGMAEHVGSKRMGEYFDRLHQLLRPRGRLLNHAIASVGGSKLGRRSFVSRYVFPDGELLDVADTVRFMERAGLEVRDVENLREHYATTLRHWVANLQEHWDEAVALVGETRARVWLLYMSASINGFDDAGLQINQTLGVRLDAAGRSDIPSTRNAWV